MSLNRAHYRERQILRYLDLDNEQAYRVAMRRRHNLAHHGWGIVQGLTLEATAMGVSLSPGFAVDGYGRELVVPRALRLGRSQFDQVLGVGGAGCVDVWLTYQLVKPARPGEYCYEDAWLRLDCCDDPASLIDPHRPPEVPESALDASPEHMLPDDPAQAWPVYLGRIGVGAGSMPVYHIELAELAYATLVGASVHTPTGYRWLQIGDEEAADNRRFAVILPDEQGGNVDRLVLGRDGDLTLTGRSRLSAAVTSALEGDGNLVLFGTAPDENAAGIGLDPLSATPETALPWQCYRTAVELTQGEQTIKVNQLRFETFHPGEEGDPARARWAVRQLDGTAFKSLLSVRSDGTVIVDGNLRVEGQLIEGAIPADVEDERFRDELLERWTKGLTLAGTEVDAYYELPLNVELERSVSGSAVTYKVTITHTGGGKGREVPILVVIGEFRDEDRLLIRSESLALEFQPPPDQAVPNPNPILPGDTMVVGATTDLGELGVTGAITLTTRIVALGAAQNQVEKTASTVFHI